MPEMERLSRIIQDRRVLNLIEQYLRRAVDRGGLFWGEGFHSALS